MTSEPKLSFPGRDRYADLEFAESLLAYALLLPRRASRDTQARVGALLELCGKPQADLGSLASKLASLRGEVFGEPYLKLRELLHQDKEDTTGKRMDISRFLNHYRGERNQAGQWEDNRALVLDSWAGSPEHSKNRRHLIDLLISVRAGVWESIRTHPNPDDPEAKVPFHATWIRTLEGDVQVRFRGIECTLSEPRLALLFVEVAKDKGQRVAWEELIRRLMVSEGEANVLSVETMRTYSRQVRDQLHPFGDLWDQGKDGVRWAGDEPIGS
jgi:hypothetical protein